MRSFPDKPAIRLVISLTERYALLDSSQSRERANCGAEESFMPVAIHAKQRSHSHLRGLAALLCAAAVSLGSGAATYSADTVVLRVGDQKGRSLLEISGLAGDLPYKIEWSEFPAAAPILEALNAGALDVGYTGDLAFLSVYAAGAPIKAIGDTRSDAKTQAILVRSDSPIKTAADLKGKRSPAPAAAGASS
jgi:sulfonate transport system substrate-binding protein